MPSEFMEILMDLQRDLNNVTISAVASNKALSALIETYNSDTYTPEKNKRNIAAWTKAINCLNDTLTTFCSDAERLEAYISGKG